MSRFTAQCNYYHQEHPEENPIGVQLSYSLSSDEENEAISRKIKFTQPNRPHNLGIGYSDKLTGILIKNVTGARLQKHPTKEEHDKLVNSIITIKYGTSRVGFAIAPGQHMFLLNPTHPHRIYLYPREVDSVATITIYPK